MPRPEAMTPLQKPFNQRTTMRTPIHKIIALALLAAALTASPLPLSAQTTTNKAPATKAEKKDPAAKKARAIPFSGNIGAIDKAAKTITVGKRTLQITSETKLQKADKPATLADGAVGDYVTGSYNKTDAGKLLAHSVYFGGRTKPEADSKK
jgi:hypothetical protein